MLDLARTLDSDPRVGRLDHVLPTLLVAPGVRNVRMGELVGERDLGTAGENRLEVHLPEGRSPVLDAFVWTDLECPDLLGGAHAPTGFDEAKDDVPAPFEPVPSPAEHCDGLADPATAPR
jgi:hypothetical protein